MWRVCMVEVSDSDFSLHAIRIHFLLYRQSTYSTLAILGSVCGLADIIFKECFLIY